MAQVSPPLFSSSAAGVRRSSPGAGVANGLNGTAKSTGSLPNTLRHEERWPSGSTWNQLPGVAQPPAAPSLGITPAQNTRGQPFVAPAGAYGPEVRLDGL